MYKVYLRKTIKVMKAIVRSKYMERDSMYVDKKTQYHQDVSSFQFDLQIQCNPAKIPTLLCEYQHTDFRVYMERQKIQNSQHDTEEEQSRKTDTTQLQDLL